MTEQNNVRAHQLSRSSSVCLLTLHAISRGEMISGSPALLLGALNFNWFLGPRKAQNPLDIFVVDWPAVCPSPAAHFLDTETISQVWSVSQRNHA